MKKLGAIIACLMLALAVTVNACACTAVYVGPKVSADGSILIAKSNDYQDVWGNYVEITERVENQPGRTMPVDNEATGYSPDDTGRTDMRVIGTDTALSVHIAQIYPDLPADMSCVTWESTGPAIYGVLVPVSNAALRISEPYARNQSAEDARHFDTENYPYYRFKELTTLCVEPNDARIYGAPVRACWHEAETVMIRDVAAALRAAADMEDRGAARQLITDVRCRFQDQAFSDAGRLLNDVRWYHSKNSNTMKNGRNPETHEILDELKPVPPMEVRLDMTEWETVLPGILAGQ